MSVYAETQKRFGYLSCIGEFSQPTFSYVTNLIFITRLVRQRSIALHSSPTALTVG